MTRQRMDDGVGGLPLVCSVPLPDSPLMASFTHFRPTSIRFVFACVTARAGIVELVMIEMENGWMIMMIKGWWR